MNETESMIELVGDVHGDFWSFKRMDRGIPLIQVGDMGIGFPEKTYKHGFHEYMVQMPENIHFIRGNHDDPALCEKHPNHMGKFGVKTINGIRIGFIGGGYSVDHPTNTEYSYRRKPGIDWWEDEELSIEDLNAAIDLIADEHEKDPIDIMVSHEAPSDICKLMIRQKPHRTRTALALQSVFENICDSKVFPKLWAYGHFHETRMIAMNGINFICLGELTKLKVDVVK